MIQQKFKKRKLFAMDIDRNILNKFSPFFTSSQKQVKKMMYHARQFHPRDENLNFSHITIMKERMKD